MLKRIINLLIALPLAAILIALAVANRHSVELILDPFRPETPVLAVSIPLYLLLFGALIVGVVIGGASTWLSQARWRRTARTQGKRAERWQAEADRLARERDASVSSSGGSSGRLALSGR